ncbi:hypothetical protein [Roseibacillus persicicus]|uniref:hypothetical protein n=1 Tax=Roseibacillus persicicus TaxID=454148 RepID=UPI00280C77C0|nr:hypothetical protein [Roseibacillus persicicus]MDQ8192354.1 hypothetical protein [Roseibacillus persicicus]
MNPSINFDESLSDEQIFDYVKDRLLPEEKLIIELHLLASPEDQERARKLREFCLSSDKLKAKLTVTSPISETGLNIVYFDFSSEKIEASLAADDSVESPVKPFSGLREQLMKQVNISGVLLKVELSAFKDESTWLRIESVEPSPIHKRFKFGIGTYRGEANLTGSPCPSFETQIPTTIPTNFANVLIQMQPTND